MESHVTTDDMEIVTALRTALAAKVGPARFELWFGEATRLEGRDHIFAEHNSHGPPMAEFYPSRAVFNGRYYYIRNLVPEKSYLLPADLEFEERWGNRAFRATIEARESHPLHYQMLKVLQEGRPPEELYDMDKDPGQLLNLAEDASHCDIRKDLAARVDAWMAETGDSILQIMKLKHVLNHAE